VNEDSPPSRATTRHFSYRIPIRMTPEERRIIGRSACALNRSISRYLVELATNPAPFQPEEKARLRSLLALFKETGRELEGLLGMALFAEAGRASGEVRRRLQEANRLLAALTDQLERRLHE
jgi:hypothetical protein